MAIFRTLTESIIETLRTKRKIVLLYGPRQVGKTTLVNQVVSVIDVKTLHINADERKYIDILSSRDLRKLDTLVSGYELLFIDEAQRIPDIGINLKILYDQRPHLKIIATGSSSFELAQSISESLTGRTWTYTLYPISYMELAHDCNDFELNEQLEERLIYGSYPDIFSFANNADKRKYLEELSTSYLYKDILELSSIKYPNKIHDLLRLLSYQIGNEVSFTELSGKLEVNKNTIYEYVKLLEKSFVLFRLSGLSRNLRKEVVQKDKYYFYDLGIRNSLIDNFKSLPERNDEGQLWENFLVLERLKKTAYSQQYMNRYFWRTYTGAEIDYVEEYGGLLHGYEFKWKKKNVMPPATWQQAYLGSTFDTIHTENYLSFVK